MRKPIRPMISRSSLVRSLTCTNILLATGLPFPRIFADHYTMSLTSRPRAWILDFDGTITTKDTIGVIANYGIEWQAKRGVDMRHVWKDIVAEYGRDYEDHVGQFTPASEDRRTLDQEIRYYQSLQEIERKSFERVSSSGLFKGIGEERWEEAGRQAVEKKDVVARKGFKEFVESLRDKECNWGIVSVNFSRAFIQGVVQASADSRNQKVEVLANGSDEDGILAGPKRDAEFREVVTTSNAKLASMKDLLESWDNQGLSVLRPVYIGDSGTDIECLLGSGVIGIIMTEDEQGSLMKAMKRIGIEVVHIGEFEEEKSRGKARYWARDFDEILQSSLLR